jgi:tetratricopeptide (TPR) repeat protein
MESADGKNADAETHFREAADVFRTLKQDEWLGWALNRIAGLMRSQKRYAEAVPVIQECIDARKRALPPDDAQIFNARMMLADNLVDTMAFGEAETLLLEADAELTAPGVAPALGVRRKNTLDKLVHIYWATGKPDRAIARSMERLRVDVAGASVRILAASSDADAARLDRARAYLRMGRFSEAKVDLDHIIQLGKAPLYAYYYRGCLQAYTHDVVGYRETCRAMFEQSKDSADGEAIERTAKTCLLLPDGAGGDPRRLLDWSEPALVAADARHRPYHLIVKALALYRTGDYAASANSAAEAAALFGPGKGNLMTATGWLIAAMAHSGLGDPAAARAELERAEGLVSDGPQLGKHDLGGGPENWLACHVLLREARELIYPSVPATKPAATGTPSAAVTPSSR